MSKYQVLSLSISDRVAIITLERSEFANGLNLELATELDAVAKEVASDDNLKAAILTGAGRFFCAGGDVKAMYDSGQPGNTVREIADLFHKAISTFARMEIPLICAVNGTAAGAGFSLAVAGDMVVAAESAKFTMAYSNIGLSPDGSSTYYLPRLIGLRKTQELMFMNPVLKANEAKEWGLINQVVADDELLNAANGIAKRFVKGSRGSNAAIKKMLLASSFNDLETQMEQESDNIQARADGVDGKEGVASFIEKRKPEFA